MIDDDARERAMWEAGKSAFWLDPDRWHGVPFGKDGRLDAFWLHLDRRAPKRSPRISKSRQFRLKPQTLQVEEAPAADLMPVYRLDDLDRLYLVGWRPR